MAFSIREKEDRRKNTDQGLLDAALMQSLQDRFCDANNVYLVCLSKRRGVVTKAYGSREELEYLHGQVNMDRHVRLMNRLLDSGIESVLEEQCDVPWIKLCGVSIKVGGETAATWIVIGIMDCAEADAPRCVMRTTPERYYKSLEFLETLSKQMFAVKMEEMIAQEAFQKSRESESQMEAELHRNEVMTSIVKMLESEKSFDVIVNAILKDVCEYMDISGGALLQADKSERFVDMICEYAEPGIMPAAEHWKQVPIGYVPFFNGKPYMISADSMMPDEFREFFERERIQAGIFLPIDVNGQMSMYLCFFEKMKTRIWDVADIKFVNDVKRIIQSILLKRIAKNSLASSYASLEAILENVGCGIYVKDPRTEAILYTNQRFRDSFLGSVEGSALERYLNDALTEQGSAYFQEIYDEKGERWFDFQRTKITWVDGRIVVLGTLYDVTDKKLYQQRIERQANNDFLTGLYNRMRCEQDLARCIAHAKKAGGEGALFYLDLDDFKHINDGLGHSYGDALLKTISESLQRIPGVKNNCYRMGGDEFIIILPHGQHSLLQRVLEEIQALFTKPWPIRDTEYYCTMSMGVVQFPSDGDTVEDLIQKADIAMYEAKCEGKNRVAYYNDKGESGSFRRLDLEKNMRNATKQSCEEFEVVYQPIVDVTKPGSPCVGAEALLRWNSKELGLISPSDFVPLAEYLGLINPIGDFVLHTACRSCKHWNDLGHPDYKVNVNLSVVQLLQNDIVEKIRAAVAESRIFPSNLTVEVTESLAINDMDRMKQILGDIRSIGVNVALDDFGTGYSSLRHIREMPIDVIKIDQCFIADIGSDEFSDAFVKMVAELANAIGVKVCVEGVETEAQYRAVAKTKIQLVQGFYFGKPMHLKEFDEAYL